MISYISTQGWAKQCYLGALLASTVYRTAERSNVYCLVSGNYQFWLSVLDAREVLLYLFFLSPFTSLLDWFMPPAWDLLSSSQLLFSLIAGLARTMIFFPLTNIVGGGWSDKWNSSEEDRKFQYFFLSPYCYQGYILICSCLIPILLPRYIWEMVLKIYEKFSLWGPLGRRFSFRRFQLLSHVEKNPNKNIYQDRWTLFFLPIVVMGLEQFY